ncbi:MAG: molybdopterin molybdotransferase MoeA [Janthinobacterium lividum]
MPLISCTDALNLIRTKMSLLALPAQTEDVALELAADRVLAQTVSADRDQPPFPRSTRDGYAMRAADAGATLTLIGAIRAGEQWTGQPPGERETIEIMTGAPVPEGADAVVMLEHVDATRNTISLAGGRSMTTGENIVPQGAEARAGDVLLHAGTRIAAAEVALAASVGAAHLQVYARPVVAILSTGDELVAVDEAPGPMQIRNSNSHGLAALVRANGGTPQVFPPVADTREALDQAINAARGADMLLLSGGVSAGKYDFVEDALLARGAEFFFTGVSIQPGKPAVFGRIHADSTNGEQWVFGLPGNPVSTQVTALLFAMPMLRALGGEGRRADRAGESTVEEAALPRPFFAGARLAEPVQVRPGLTRFLPALLTSSLEGATVQTTGWQGSGDLNGNARANCYLVVPPTASALASGDAVSVLLR